MIEMLKIFFDGNKFIVAQGARVFKHNLVSGNGWNCRINRDGSIKCVATDKKKGKYVRTSFKISILGLTTITKMEGGVRHEHLRYRIRNWPISGVILLTGGDDEERRASFNKVDL